ncbi:MAG: alpha/beta fold hydrolase [Pseudomonadota bacterium]
MQHTVDCDYSVEGSGPPLVLIHGIGAARDAWRFVTPDLTAHFTVVRYDLRGHGSSPPAEPGFGLEELVNDLVSVCDRAGFDAVHLAGHSLGGMIAPAFARRNPARVRSMSLLSTAAFRTADDRAKVAAVVKAMTEQGIADVLPTLTNRWFTDDFIAANPAVVERRMAQVIGTDAATFLNVFHIYATTEMQPWIADIETPALVLTGEHDGGCPPRLNAQIADAMPNSSLVVLDGLKHAVQLEAPKRVAAAVRDFASRHP